MKKSYGSKGARSSRNLLLSGRRKPVSTCKLEAGEVYLFFRQGVPASMERVLWAMVDRRDGETLFLESSSPDLRHFQKWHRLSSSYRYCRRSTRAELRDYMVGLVCQEVPFADEPVPNPFSE